VIDGDLSDWGFVTTVPIPVTNKILCWWDNKYFDSKIPNKTPEDFSGSFQCFYDSYNLYVAVKVKDDHFISGREPFAFNLFEDCVEITFNGDSDQWYQAGNYGQTRVYADDKTGKTYVEMGGLFPPWETYPYIWEELGVKAVLKQNEQGYSVEVAIPTRILGWSTFEPNRPIGLNVKINDFDGNSDKDCALIWAKDNNPDENQWHNLVSFNTSVSRQKDSQPVSDLAGEGKNIVAVLGNPDDAQSFDTVKAIYRAYSQKDYAETERLLNLSSNNNYWKKFFLGNIRFNTKNYSESSQILLSLANEAPDECLSRLALYKSGRALMRAGDKMKALEMFGKVLLSTVELHAGLGSTIFEVLQLSIAELIRDEPIDSPVLKKKDEIIGQYTETYIKNMDVIPVDVPSIFQLVKMGLYEVKDYYSSLRLLEKIDNTTLDNKMISRAKLERARCYFYMGDYENSIQLGNDLISSFYPEINLEANMVLLSINKIKNK
jgi:tetratricopeptide (TPR) repeat protein